MLQKLEIFHLYCGLRNVAEGFFIGNQIKHLEKVRKSTLRGIDYQQWKFHLS